ncbi:MAG: ATP-binding protein [bacterium]|nr:MAG: ATP-binding protein [bacterium]
MPIYELEMVGRHFRRQFEKATGKSIVKIITELITNSDDSYKRMIPSDNENSQIKEILIIADHRKKVISVIDQAEGISESEMEDKFKPYGKDSGDISKGYQTRSLFGKGLRDVLYSQMSGTVKSVKDGQLNTAKFYFSKNNKPMIRTTSTKIKKRTRKSLGIRENGTLVEFRLRDDINLPDHETLCDKIRNFYMLRKINSNPLRKIILKSISTKGEKQSEIVFTQPSGQNIFSETAVAQVRDKGIKEFPLTIEIFRADTELSQTEAGVEDRVGGLLIIDEGDNVLDLTLFKFERNIAATYLFGTVQVNGAGKYIRGKLNQEYPEEILTETRDGFDKRTSFYKGLARVLNPILEPIVKEEESRRKRSAGSFTDQRQKKWDNAIRLLNRLWDELVGKAETGDEFTGREKFIPETIAFIRDEIFITENVETPIALLVNINTILDGTMISLESSTNMIEVSPDDIKVIHENAKDDLFLKVIRLTGKKSGTEGYITASTSEFDAQVKIQVISKSMYYPLNGFSFKPLQLNLSEERKRNLSLYLDYDKVPIGSEIKFAVSDSFFKLDFHTIEVTKEYEIANNIAEIKIPIMGRGIGNNCIVTAVFEDLSTEAMVKIIDKSKREKPKKKGDMFREPVFEEIPQLKRQSFLNLNEGTIIINTADELNKRYFGVDDPWARIESEVHCQTRLADLVLDECLYYIVSKAWGISLEKRFPNDPATDIREYVMNKKFEIGPTFHAIFVTLPIRTNDIQTSKRNISKDVKTDTEKPSAKLE